jgi:hypothetical protein
VMDDDFEYFDYELEDMINNEDTAPRRNRISFPRPVEEKAHRSSSRGHQSMSSSSKKANGIPKHGHGIYLYDAWNVKSWK